jgi:hypothetical protein
MSFIARFPGDCEHCEEPVEIGQECVMLDYDKGLICHHRCPAPVQRPAVVVCPRCFLVHAGECL